jgi:hypothetical protein
LQDKQEDKLLQLAHWEGQAVQLPWEFKKYPVVQEVQEVELHDTQLFEGQATHCAFVP